MTKKIYDILPPKVELEEKKAKSAPKDFRIKTEKNKERDSKTPIFKIIFFFTLLILIGGGVFCYLTLSKAEIEIWPETTDLNLDTKLTIDKAVVQIDLENKIIPAKVFETNQIEVTEEFPASGEIKKKATGVVRVYNNYSSNPQIFVANTRLMSDSGLVFLTEEKIVVPAKPGYIDAKVVAAEGGENYNIGPSTFSIPGLAGKPLYTYFYGKSFSPMSGGGKSYKVNQEDLDKAEEVLTEKALESCNNSLKDLVPSDFVFLEDATQCEVVETFSPIKSGVELDKFIFTVKIKGKILSFKSEDLKNIAKSLAASQDPEVDTIYEKNLEMNYSVENLDLQTGKIILSLRLKGKAYSDIDQKIIKEALKGKSQAESQLILENQTKIKKVQVDFWPFWVNKVPDEADKIILRLNLD